MRRLFSLKFSDYVKAAGAVDVEGTFEDVRNAIIRNRDAIIDGTHRAKQNNVNWYDCIGIIVVRLGAENPDEVASAMDSLNDEDEWNRARCITLMYMRKDEDFVTWENGAEKSYSGIECVHGYWENEAYGVDEQEDDFVIRL